MFKRSVCFILAAAFFGAGAFLSAQEILTSDEYSIPRTSGEIFWYRSNSSGLALEFVPSRLAALRNEYCLSVEKFPLLAIPRVLMPYYSDLFSAELRIIYKNGAEYRRQWIFRDDQGYARLTASGSVGFFGERKAAVPPAGTEAGAVSKNGDSSPAGENPSGFIEIRDSDGAITKEMSFEDDLSEWEFRYFYKENILLSAEILFKEPPPSIPEGDKEKSPEGAAESAGRASPPEPAAESAGRGSPPEGAAIAAVFVLVSTDYYRYSRSGSLRAIDRTIHEGGGNISRSTFPHIGPRFSLSEDFFSRGNDYSSDFLLEVDTSGAKNVTYSIDSRGRILTETWKDEDGKVVGEFRNTWSGDRLDSVVWKSDEEERLVEYEYDGDGNRIAERDFRQGILERSVSGRDGKETEEIYMDGRLILRAYWENGLKIREERVSSSGGEPRSRTSAAGSGSGSRRQAGNPGESR